MAITRKQILYIAGTISILILFHVFRIDLKSIHHDESINGWFLLQMGREHFYRYDPSNYHGPFFFYFAKIIETIFGANYLSLRISAAIFSVMTWSMVLSWGVYRKSSLQFFALIAGLGPAVLFFGRSGIHESTFVFFQVMVMIGFLEWRKFGNTKGIVIICYGLIGASLNKETFVLGVVAALVGFVFSMDWKLNDHPANHLEDGSNISLKGSFKSSFKNNFKWIEDFKTLSWSVHGPILIFLYLGFFSGFGYNWNGILDSIRAFLPWLKTGQAGAGHGKPWFFWLSTIQKNEYFIFTAVLVAIYSVFTRQRLRRGLAVFAIFNLLIYSVIPYKTIWCLLTISWPFVFVFGLFIDQLTLPARKVATLAVVFTLVALINLWTLRSILFVAPLNYEHNYVYVQTLPQMKELNQFIHAKSRLFPGKIITAAKDAWPLPFLFHDIPSYVYLNETLQVLEMDMKEILVLAIDKSLATKPLYQLYEGWPQRSFHIREAREPVIIFFRPEFFQNDETLNSNIFEPHQAPDFSQ